MQSYPTGNLDVGGVVDDINISPDALLLVHNNQTFTGGLTFLNDLCFEDDVNIDGLVDGVDLSDLKEKAVFHTGAFTITGNLRMIMVPTCSIQNK